MNDANASGILPLASNSSSGSILHTDKEYHNVKNPEMKAQANGKHYPAKNMVLIQSKTRECNMLLIHLASFSTLLRLASWELQPFDTLRCDTMLKPKSEVSKRKSTGKASTE